MWAIPEPGSHCTWRSRHPTCLRATSMIDSSARNHFTRGRLVVPGMAAEETHVGSLLLPTELRDAIVQFLGRCLPPKAWVCWPCARSAPAGPRLALTPAGIWMSRLDDLQWTRPTS